MIDQAIILAGGKGTRLQSVVRDVPKVMAEVAGKPFLTYILDELVRFNVTDVVLSVGYKHETIMDYFKERYRSLKLTYAIESSPLGTGGGIKYASGFLSDEPFLLINGDTLYKMDLEEFSNFHFSKHADISVALKQMKNPDRYGTVTTDEDRITGFKEKRTGLSSGWINAGTYILSRSVFNEIEEDVFSFEERIFEKGINSYVINGWKTDGYFIDIGIPEDYKKANEDIKEAGD